MKTFDERRKSVEENMKKIRRKRRALGTAFTGAACMVLAVAILAGVLFVPYNTTPPSVKQYADSPYYELIQKLNVASFTPPEYKNRFAALAAALGGIVRNGTDGMVKGEAMWPVPGATNAVMNENGNGEYAEVTDNQVQGVIEADIFKRSTEYIYYLRGNKLSIYSIAGEDSKWQGTFEISMEDMFYTNCVEMYLTEDCKTVVVLLSGYSKTEGSVTYLISLDVTDHSNVKETNRLWFRGSYLSSRMVDGTILLSYNYAVDQGQVDYNDPTTFVPTYGTEEGNYCIPGEDIICPETASASRYTVVCSVDTASMEVGGSVALLSYSQELYVSATTIYATYSYTAKTDNGDGSWTSATMTEITGISYADSSLEILGTVTLEGNVKNQYSMDEHDGILRVVTSTNARTWKEYNDGAMASVSLNRSKQNVNLYCVDVNTWQIAASVIGFAPEGETAESVRFDGDKAYVCTAVVMTLTDPVYFFDLSDLENITWTDTGTIDGYSTSLIQLKNGYLLGIGYGDSRQLKIEVYGECNGKVVSVCSYEMDASFSEEYKSYLIDRENNLFGLAVSDWMTSQESYILLHFDGYDLNLVTAAKAEGQIANARAVIIDGWLYVLSESFDVVSLG